MKIRVKTSWVVGLVLTGMLCVLGAPSALADIDDLLEDDGLLGGEEDEAVEEAPPEKEPEPEPPAQDDEEEYEDDDKDEYEDDEDEEESEDEDDEEEEEYEDDEDERPSRRYDDEDRYDEDEDEEEEEEEEPAPRRRRSSSKRAGVELGVGFANKLFIPALPKVIFPEAKDPKTAGLPGDMYMPGAALSIGYDLGPHAGWPEFWLKFNTGFSFAGGDMMALYMLDLGLMLEKKFEISKDSFYWHLGLGPQFPLIIADVGKAAGEKDDNGTAYTGGMQINAGVGFTTGPDVVIVNSKGFAMHFRLALVFHQYFLPLDDFGGWSMTSDYKNGKRYYTKGWTASNLSITPGFNFIF